MKKILLTAMIAAFTVAAVNAQEITERKQDKPALEEKKKGLESLNLTPEQREKIKSLKEAHKQEVDEMKKEGASQENIEAVRQKHHEQIQSILTDEQRVELKKIKVAEKAAVKEEKSKEKVAAAAKTTSKEELKAKIKAIQDDPNLTDEQKMEKTKELVQVLKKAQKEELTPEEIEKGKQQKKHTLEKKN